MKMKMRDEDRRAIDVLLDRTPIAAGKSHGAPIYAAANGHLRQRVSRVEKVLEILGNLPANEPPRTLVAETLQFIERSTGEKLSRVRHANHGFAAGHQSHPA